MAKINSVFLCILDISECISMVAFRTLLLFIQGEEARGFAGEFCGSDREAAPGRRSGQD